MTEDTIYDRMMGVIDTVSEQSLSRKEFEELIKKEAKYLYKETERVYQPEILFNNSSTHDIGLHGKKYKEFNRDNKKGRVGEVLEADVEGGRVTQDKIDGSIEIVAVLDDKDNIVTIEVKTETGIHQGTGRVYLEFYSRGKPSSFNITTADMITIIFIHKNSEQRASSHRVDTRAFKIAVQRFFAFNDEVVGSLGGDGKSSTGIALPIKFLCDMIKESELTNGWRDEILININGGLTLTKKQAAFGIISENRLFNKVPKESLIRDIKKREDYYNSKEMEIYWKDYDSIKKLKSGI